MKKTMWNFLNNHVLNKLWGTSLVFVLLVGCQSTPPTVVSPAPSPSLLPPPPPQASIRTVPNTAPTATASVGASPESSPVAQAAPTTGGDRDRGAITFAPGSTSASVEGSLPRRAIDRYTFIASTGQNGTISIESPDQTVLLTLIDPQGSPIQRYQSGSSSWSGKLSDSGTYIIDVVSTKEASTYTLNISIQP
ncbi:hypothetical protein [Myxacorys almedinensis]|uniref:Uncharacterized protein n=1 Tax=Myxacorys almedinensis A TaxID=2690445 RepID=A0A8J8CKJ9_9CYAN|nr:hypothetical protein [Myxacorys almedinensis]NDJ18696.1 hypothetical protein [Myxacorys almedinensis A]